MLGTKYPRAMLPKSQAECVETKFEHGLELSFLNMDSVYGTFSTNFACTVKRYLCNFNILNIYTPDF